MSGFACEHGFACEYSFACEHGFAVFMGCNGHVFNPLNACLHNSIKEIRAYHYYHY